MNNRTPLSSWQVTTLQLALAGVVWSPVMPALAAPAQLPLFMRAAKLVAPNIMLTFDDSGSMSWSHLPDSLWPYTVTPVLHPNDPEGYVYKCLAPTTTSDIKMLQVRSPAFNKAYYDPGIYYRPWSKPDGSVAPNASFTSAAAYPAQLVRGQTANPVINLSTTSSSYRAPWCVATNNGARYYNTNGGDDSQVCDNNNDSKCSALAFNPAIYFRFTGDLTNSSSVNNTSNYKLIDLNSQSSYDSLALAKDPRRTDCAGTKCTYAEERANFANWFTYYRSRNYIAKAGVSRAFGAQTSDLRVGYGQINKTTRASELNNVSGAPSSTIVRGVRSFAVGSTDRQAFFDWLYDVDASGGTPLRRAMDDVGKYYSVTPDIGPWGNYPGVSSSSTSAQTNQKSCRKSYHILTTDGYWNGSGAATTGAQGNVDNTTGPTITGPNSQSYTYVPSAKYRDTGSGTLADVAMYYWNRDLHPDLANRVPPSKGAKQATDTGDYAFWQHMTTFTVGLGVLGTVKDTSVVPPAGGWPVPPTDGNDVRTVDDLWHAAVNGRGESLQATDPDNFAEALKKFLDQINDAQVPPVTSTSFSSFVLSGSTKRYKPSYDTTTWSGSFQAFKASDSGEAAPLWDAAKKIPAAADRVIATWKQSSKSPTNFQTGNLDSTASAWGGTSPSSDLISFLRGDRSKEGSTFRCRGASRGTTDCAKTIEDNLGRLGDIVNSKAVLVKGGVDLDYQLLPSAVGGSGSYRAHVAAKKSRTDGLVFVGANDGMLHAFLDSTGEEKFAYVPYATYGNLARLANPKYGDENTPGAEHRYFVDGPLTETDIYRNGWLNTVVGSAGGGAKAIFAVTVPTNSTVPSMSSGNLLLEYNSSSDSNGSKLGYVTQPIAVGPTKGGDWVAVFGNGPDSDAGQAYLFVVSLISGQSWVIQAGSGGIGLGGVSVIRNSERVIIGAYAGDYSGKLWRFDMDSTNPGNWKLGFGGNALYDAGSGKPITAPPAYFAHPKGDGVMVVFGSGSLYAEGDQDNTSAQTLYGVWDKTVVGQASSSSATVTSNLLVEQKFTDSITSGDQVFVKSSQNAINWTDKRGWFLNLTLQAGQRNLYMPLFIDRYAYFATVAPKGTGDDCEGTQSVGYNIFVDALTGAMSTQALLDTNRDGFVNSSDTIVSTVKNATGDVGQPAIVADPFDKDNNPDGGNFKIVPGGPNGEGLPFQPPGGFTQRHWRLITNYPGQNSSSGR